jgi:hypothetical protein
MEERLFDVEPVDPPELESVSADRRLTRRNREHLDNGVHPATFRPVLVGWGFTCGDCAYLRRYRYHARSYVKCAEHRLGESHSSASDVRVGWPACELLRIDA